MTAEVNTSTTKEKPVRKERLCSVCKQPGHNKLKCPEAKAQEEEAITEMVKRQSIVYDSDDKTEVLKKCAYRHCKNVVDGTGYGEYCSYAHAMAVRYQKQLMSDAKNKYKVEFSNETFWQYIHECEQSHNPFYVKIDDNLVPMKRMKLPSVAGYASFLGVYKLTLKNWAMKYAEFRETMLFLKQIQEEFLTNNGAAGLYKEKITALMLMNNHGMKERSERTNNHLIGVVRRVYDKADSYEQDGSLEQAFEGQFEETDDDIARDVK